MKKAAVMLYPMFSMQEISCLTELFKFDEKGIVTFSAGGEAVKSEDAFPVMPRSGIVRTYLVEDGNLITAHGGAFREFAAAVGRKVGLDCPDTVFSPMAGEEYAEEDFVFRFPPEALEEVRADWDRCLRAAENTK